VCEFCHQHGEGKIWYLQIKNYVADLLHSDLSAEEQEIVGTSTRQEWVERFMSFANLKPVSVPQRKTADRATKPQPGALQPGASQTAPEAPRRSAPWSEAEIVHRRKVAHFGQVLPIEDVEKVFDLVDSITRVPCVCRYMSLGKLDKRYCFAVAAGPANWLAGFPDSSLSLERLDRDEAKEMLRGFDREGLIHSIWTGVTPFVIGVCNCDRDCGAYGGYIEKGGPPSFFRAEYVAKVDWDACNGCRNCVRQCQFGAVFYSSVNSKVYINPARCYGCGVCRAACRQDAIRLLPRKEVPEAANLWLKNTPLSTVV
jgi:ferredoxin